LARVTHKYTEPLAGGPNLKAPKTPHTSLTVLASKLWGFDMYKMTNEKSIWSFDDADVTPEIQEARMYDFRVRLAVMSGFRKNHKLQNTVRATYYLNRAGLETLGL
jgi:hypothetical protein